MWTRAQAIVSAHKMSTVITVATIFALAAIEARAQVQGGGAEHRALYQFNLPEQSLAEALKAIGQRTATNILFDPDSVVGIVAPALRATLTAAEAIERVLAGTELTAHRSAPDTVLVQGARGRRVSTGKGVEAGTRSKVGGALMGEGAVRVAQVQEEASKECRATVASAEEVNEKSESDASGIPEILVTGSKVLNTDIRRTENDIQPYVVFDRNRIERSGATNLEEFFKNELTVNVTHRMSSQVETLGNRSRIDIRGLGDDETLILLDGRRAAGFNFGGEPSQPDINAIPLAAVERIEVLPTTASGIFGGGATGGVVNVVLRRDYAGFDTQITYGNSFESDITSRRVDLSAGFNLEDGRTNVLLSGSYSDANPLLAQERNFIQHGRQHILDINDNDVQALNQFGSPPLGATPNIRSEDGTNLTLDNGTALNAPITFIPEGYVGAASDGGAGLIANAGRYNLDLSHTAQQGGGRYGLLSAPEVKSLMLTIRREFTPRLQAFAELKASDSSTEYSANFANLTTTLAGDAPNNPFQQAIRVTVPTVGMDNAVASNAKDSRAVLGVIAQLPRQWQAALDFTWNRSRSSYAWAPELSFATLDAVSSGTLDVLVDVDQFNIPWESRIPSSQSPGEMELRNTAFRLGGALPWMLPGGSSVVSLVLEHREEAINDVVRVCGGCGGAAFLYPTRSQKVDSAYVEARLPLASPVNRRPGLELLELQIAARRDDYRVTGANSPIDLSAPVTIERTTNRNSSDDPTVGFRYRPVPDLTLRASYGTGYLPPSVSQLASEPPFPFNLGFAGLMDPLRGNEPISTVQFIAGGNRDLRPERSESWSVGFIATPRVSPKLRFAADWSVIKKIDNIGNAFLFGAQAQTDLETMISFFPERVMRGAPSDGFPVGPIIGLDNTSINLARMRVEAVDLALDYTFETEHFGTFDIATDATRLIGRETQAAPGAVTIENVGVATAFESNLKWRANASLNWSYEVWYFGWRTRFFDSYFLSADHSVDSRQGSASIAKQMYHDFYGGYRFPSDVTSKFSAFADIEVRIGINNVFNREPLVDVVNNGILMYSYLGDPRLANYYLSISKSFGR